MSTAGNPSGSTRANGPSSGSPDFERGQDTAVQPPVPPDRREVVAREKDEFGGMKVGATFFGWLAATGMIVLLTVLTTAVALAFGLNAGVDPNAATSNALAAFGIVGAVVLLVIVFLGYLSGGYVAGRMARFSGLKQGFGVWLWAVVFAVVSAILGFVAGSQLQLPPGTPQVTFDRSALTVASVVTLLIVAAVALIGAVLGGLLGMRYHRRVDRAGLGR